MKETKSYSISKKIVLEAFQKVKENNGTYGVDDQSIGKSEENLKDSL